MVHVLWGYCLLYHWCQECSQTWARNKFEGGWISNCLECISLKRTASPKDHYFFPLPSSPSLLSRLKWVEWRLLHYMNWTNLSFSSFFLPFPFLSFSIHSRLLLFICTQSQTFLLFFFLSPSLLYRAFSLFFPPFSDFLMHPPISIGGSVLSSFRPSVCPSKNDDSSPDKRCGREDACIDPSRDASICPPRLIFF